MEINQPSANLKSLGRVREFSKIDSDPSIPDLRNQLSELEASKVKTYLDGGTGAMGWMEWLRDPLSGDAIGPHETYTDGTWFWRSDLAFLVNRYRIGLPQEFLDLVAMKKIPDPVAMTKELLDETMRVGW